MTALWRTLLKPLLDPLFSVLSLLSHFSNGPLQSAVWYTCKELQKILFDFENSSDELHAESNVFHGTMIAKQRIRGGLCNK